MSELAGRRANRQHQIIAEAENAFRAFLQDPTDYSQDLDPFSIYVGLYLRLLEAYGHDEMRAADFIEALVEAPLPARLYEIDGGADG